MKNIKLKGMKNTRDLGGIPVEGGVIKKGRLIRASHLSKAADSALDTLKSEYRLKTVIDLRNSLEKAEKPDRAIDGVTFLEMPVFDDSIPGLSHETKQDIDHIPSMVKLYNAVVNGGSFDNLCDAVCYIVRAGDDDFSILYHCTEGKDRTGMVTALLLTVLGADRQTILDDYLFTNKVNRKKALSYRFLVRTVKHNEYASHMVYNVFIAREEYINEVFKVIDKFGGRESFIKNKLRLTDDEVAAFKKRVTQ